MAADDVMSMIRDGSEYISEKLFYSPVDAVVRLSDMNMNMRYD